VRARLLTPNMVPIELQDVEVLQKFGGERLEINLRHFDRVESCRENRRAPRALKLVEDTLLVDSDIIDGDEPLAIVLVIGDIYYALPWLGNILYAFFIYAI
jgi:hypothetical protein